MVKKNTINGNAVLQEKDDAINDSNARKRRNECSYLTPRRNVGLSQISMEVF